METLREQVAAFNGLISQGETILAMERFYSEQVEMQENEEPPRCGKTRCINHERTNLDKVSNFQIQILNQAIDEKNGMVFTEMEIGFKPLQGQPMKLREVSVQRWINGQVVQEKFYYKTMMTA